MGVVVAQIFTEAEIRDEYATAQGTFTSEVDYESGLRRYIEKYLEPCSKKPGYYIRKV